MVERVKSKRIMRAFKMKEISGVDVPAQAGAKVTIIKQGKMLDADAVLAKGLLKYWGPVEGSAEARSFSDVLGQYFEQQEQQEILQEVWPVISALDTSLRSIIGDSEISQARKLSMMEEAVNDFLMAIREELSAEEAAAVVEKLDEMLSCAKSLEALEDKMLARKVDSLQKRAEALKKQYCTV